MPTRRARGSLPWTVDLSTIRRMLSGDVAYQALDASSNTRSCTAWSDVAPYALAMSSVISPAASASKTTGANDASRSLPSTNRIVWPNRRATSSTLAPDSMMLANAWASSAGFIARRWKFSARLTSRIDVSSPPTTRHVIGILRATTFSSAKAKSALRRRPPASTSNNPFLAGRTTRFCNNPWAAILAFSSASAFGSACLRTFRGLGTSLFNAIDWIIITLLMLEPMLRHSAHHSS